MPFFRELRRECCMSNLIALILLIFVGLVLWPLSPKPNPNVSGIFLPSEPLSGKTVAPDQVQILQMPPPQAHVIGTVSTKIHYYQASFSADETHVAESTAFAQKLAGAAGANAIVITELGRTADEGPLDGFQLIATALADS